MKRTPILTAEQMRAADKATIEAGTPEVALMQRAGHALADIVKAHYPPCNVLVMCGSGNNGWDGRIAARHLRESGFIVNEVTPADDYQPWLFSCELIIDALLGTGLNKPVKNEYAEAIAAMNAQGVPIIACDIPSGINATTGEIMGCAVKAVRTVTFAAAKRGHYLLPGKAHIGRLHVVDIGIRVEDSGVLLNTQELWRLPKRNIGDHKYKRGHAMVMGGEITSAGASKLASLAALKMGAGAVSVICDKETLPVYAASLMAVMTKPADDMAAFEALITEKRVSALAIGPGAGVTPRTSAHVHAMLATNKPCVLDADALQPDIVGHLNANCIITPHAGEFERLFSKAELKVDAVQQAVTRFPGVVVFKGSDTVIAQAGKPVVINANAPSTLATAGSGDVLAGIITGLLAQGMKPFDAACAGVWIHGHVATRLGKYLTAEDLIGGIGNLQID